MTWTSGPIQQFCEGIFDGPHATPQESEEGPIFLGIQNVSAEGRLDLSSIRHVSEKEFSQWTRRVTPRDGDVVFSYEATLHRYALIPAGFRGCLGRRMALVRTDRTKLEARFLLYYFLSPQWKQVMEANRVLGATVDRIPLKTFPNFPLRVPSLAVQHRIADLLSAYDDLIENNRRRTGLLEEVARLLYREWFVHFRFPGHEHVPLVDSLPDGWQRRELGSVLTLQRGFDLPSDRRVEGDVPVFGSTGIVGKHNVARVSTPTVITGRSGSLGLVAYVDEPSWPLNTSLWVKEFKACSPLFAYFLLTSLNLTIYNGGASVPTLDRNVVHKAMVALPPRHLADAFVEQASALFLQKRKLEEQNQKLARARDILLPRLMSGKVAV